MIARVFFFLLGFGLTIIGFTSMILYMNLFSFGYTMTEYLSFLVKRPECLLALVGLLILTVTIFKKGGTKYDLYL